MRYLYFASREKEKRKMKIAIFCAKSAGLLYVLCLLPDGVTEISSAERMDFGISDIAKKVGCSYKCFNSAEEAIDEADRVFVIWDGMDKRMTDAVKTAKRKGKEVMFSFLP